MFSNIRAFYAIAGILLVSLRGGAIDFRIDEIQRQNEQINFRFTNELGFYYKLLRGENPADIHLTTDLVLSATPPSALSDTNATNGMQFYRVEKVPLISLRDTDGDGICDAWELLHRHPGAALNANDTNEDHDANGVLDRVDALREGLRSGAMRGRPVLAAGSYHSLAIKKDGTLWGWGDNSAGQLGSSAFTETNGPTQIGTDADWEAVSAADLVSFGLKTNGTLWVWGQTPGGTPVLFLIGTNTDWIGLPQRQISASPTALRADGTRWQFIGSFANAQQLGSNDWAAVADDAVAGHWAIKRDGTLWNGLSLFDTNQSWNSISLGVAHALALRIDGTLWAWQSSCCQPAAEGQLGLGNAQPTVPTQVGTDTWAAVTAGFYHSVGIKSDGSLWWWGANYGFAPNGAGIVRTNLPIRFGTNTDWIAVTAGNSHTLALREDGTVWTFGFNELGKLGNGTTALVTQPTQVGTNQDWSAAVIGNLYSLGLKTNGTLWAWGANPYGVQGVGDFSYSSLPRQVPGSNWLMVSGGGDHTVALQQDGSLWTWGKYIYSNFVNDVFTNLPTQLGTDFDWVKVSAGWQHSLATKSNHTLWAWGRNVWGELGIGPSGPNENMPIQVGSLGAWTNFSAGNYASLGVLGSGLFSWGTAVGSGGFSGDLSPRQVGFDFNWHSVANAKSHFNLISHALALKRNGTLWAWGTSSRGQLGTNSQSSFPVQVGSTTNWSQIAVGDLFSGALQTDGTLWMTGFNLYGQLGLGTRADTNLFTRVGTGTNWSSIALGYRHVVALQTDGSLWAWGDNSYGQCAQPALFEPIPIAGTNWGKP